MAGSKLSRDKARDTRAARPDDIAERGQVELALRASEAKYQALFESIDEGLCIIEVIFDQQDKPVDYRFLEVNPAFERQTGLSGALGRTVRDFVPQHEQHWFDIYGRIALTGEPARFEQRAARLNRWYDVYAWRYGRPQDRRVAVLFNDISARKSAEEALRASEAQVAAELADSKLLQSISSELVHEKDSNALYGKIVDAAVAIMHADFASMQKFYPERGKAGELRLLAFRGFNPRAAQFWEWVRADSDCTCGIALRTGKRVIEADVARSGIMAGSQDQAICLQTGILAVQSTPLFARDGNLVGMISTHWRAPYHPSDRGLRLLDILARQAADLIERRRDEEEIAQLAAIVETSDDAIISKDLDGVITSWNRGAARLFGYTAREAIGRPVTLLIPAERLDEEPGILQRIRDGLRIEHYETMRRRKDGTLVDVSLSVSPILDASGKIIGASKIARDITERKRAERQAEEDARIREALYRVSRMLAGELDVDRMVQAVTDTSTQLCGAQFGAFFYNVKNAAGESYLLYALSGAPREAFEKFGMPRNTAVFEPTFSGREVVRLDDVTQDPRYGKSAPHHGMPEGHLPVRSYLAAPVKSRTGEVFGALFFGHPQPGVFTERSEALVTGVAAQVAVAMDNARLVAQLRESDRNKDDFLAMLSHELRNPLAPMRHCVTLLQQADEGEIRRHAGEILDRQVEHMTRLVEDLLDISRISRGDIDLRKNEVDLADVVRIAVETSRPLFEAAGHRLDVNLPRSPVNVVADRLRLAQVFSNLLTNAAKYTPAGGRIGLELSKANGTVAISVRDNGIGIAAGDLPRLFSMYTQLEGGRRRSPGGLGVGLALARQLVELHGGTIEARSEGTGQGSEFTVRIPLPDRRPGAVN
jgi:PAS domain S-box-containing protein